MLTDQHWLKLKSIVHNFGIYLKHNLRNFIEAILYRIRTGCPWRDLPEVFGNQTPFLKILVGVKIKLLKIFKLLSIMQI
jgi:transposase